MKNSRKYLTWISVILLLTLGTSCSGSDDEQPSTITIISNSGNPVNMEGLWNSGCVTDLGMHLSQTFLFNGPSIVIDINFFQENNCSTTTGTEKVTLTYKVIGTIEATLNGQMVIANKIVGTQTLASTGTTEAFKQTFYVDDTQGNLILHHARFQDDGGKLSSDGFPTELIAINITKQ